MTWGSKSKNAEEMPTKNDRSTTLHSMAITLYIAGLFELNVLIGLPAGKWFRAQQHKFSFCMNTLLLLQLTGLAGRYINKNAVRLIISLLLLLC